MRFFKLEALGNDFILVDARATRYRPGSAEICGLANRRTGIGFDQMLVLRPGSENSLAEVDIFNADGSRAEQCGNGMRAIAAWLDRTGQLSPGTILGTPAGPVELAAKEGDRYTAVLPGPRRIQTETLNLSTPCFPDDVSDWTLVSLGNPHLIATVSAPPTAKGLARTMAALDSGGWSGRVNVGLMHADSDHSVSLRVHERGAGPTQACGSAACAAAWALRQQRPGAADIAVRQPGGTLVVDLASSPGFAVTTGAATVVFEGRIS